MENDYKRVSTNEKRKKIIQTKRRNRGLCVYCGRYQEKEQHECKEDYSYVFFKDNNSKKSSDLARKKQLYNTNTEDVVVTKTVQEIFTNTDNNQKSEGGEVESDTTGNTLDNNQSNSVKLPSKETIIVNEDVNFFDVTCTQSRQFNKYHVLFLDSVIVPFNVIHPLSTFAYNEPRIICVNSKLYYNNTNFIRAFRRVNHTYVVEKLINFDLLKELANDTRCRFLFFLTNNIENSIVFLKALEELTFVGFPMEIVKSKFYLIFESMFTELVSQRFKGYNIFNVNPNKNQSSFMVYLNILRQCG